MKADNEAERIVLLNSWEDYALLWQIIQDVQEAMPAESSATALRVAREAVFSLLSKGMLETYRRKSRRDPFELLNAAEGAIALNNDAYWRGDDQDTVEIAVATTQKGDEALKLPS